MRFLIIYMSYYICGSDFLYVILYVHIQGSVVCVSWLHIRMVGIRFLRTYKGVWYPGARHKGVRYAFPNCMCDCDTSTMWHYSMETCTDKHTHAHTHSLSHTHKHMYAMCVYMHACMCVCGCMCVCETVCQRACLRARIHAQKHRV